jgi:hypothetical protein
MSDTGNKKPAKKKQKLMKVSEIDFKIMLLENRGPVLSDKERQRLESLKEQKALQARQGFNISKTAKVPSEWLGEINPAQTEMNTNENSPKSKMNSKGVIKQGYSNAFLQFRSEKKASLNSIDPKAKLDLNQVREEWKNMDDSAKAPYKKKAEEEKEQLGHNLRSYYLKKKSQISEDDKKKARLEADRKHKVKLRFTKAKALEESKQCSIRFQEILESKTKQMSEEVEMNESLKRSTGKTRLENSLAEELIKEKEAEIEKLKEKYRFLHRIHKFCSLSKQ